MLGEHSWERWTIQDRSVACKQARISQEGGLWLVNLSVTHDREDWGAAADGIGRRGNVGKRHEEGGHLDRLWRTRRQTTQGAGRRR